MWWAFGAEQSQSHLLVLQNKNLKGTFWENAYSRYSQELDEKPDTTLFLVQEIWS